MWHLMCVVIFACFHFLLAWFGSVLFSVHVLSLVGRDVVYCMVMLFCIVHCA